MLPDKDAVYFSQNQVRFIFTQAPETIKQLLLYTQSCTIVNTNPTKKRLAVWRIPKGYCDPPKTGL